MINAEGLAMVSETHIFAHRYRAKDSPQRRRDHRDGPPFDNEAGSGFLLRALRASVVRNRRNKPNSEALQV